MFWPKRNGKYVFQWLKPSFLHKTMCGTWYRVNLIDDITGCVHFYSTGILLVLFVFVWSKKMSDIEVLSSESSFEQSEVVSGNEEDDDGDYFELNENFAPYKGEPLANSEDATMSVEDEDEGGVLPSVLEQRLEGEIAVNDW